MDWKGFAAAFGIVFLAELGDKTQLAALALASRTKNPVGVFLGAWTALGVATLLGVAAGAALGRFLPTRVVSCAAAVLFIVVGVWMLWRQLSQPGGAA